MDVIYKVGVIVGIIAIYSLVTWGIGAITTSGDYDDGAAAAVAWTIGMVAFVALAVFTLERFGLWK